MTTQRERRTIRIIAPSNSLATVPAELRDVGVARLQELGFHVEFGEHVHEIVLHSVGSVEHRAEDFDAAVADPSVDIVMAAQGGSNSNQLLDRIDYGRVRSTNKVFVGYSDISGLLIALGKHAGASVVHAPSFSELCNPILPDYTVKGLLACLDGRRAEYTSPSATSDDIWHCGDNSERAHTIFDGWKVLRGGKAAGPIVGGNLVTVSVLSGTRHFPKTEGTIFFLEDAVGQGAGAIHRELTHLAQLGAFDGLAAFMIGKVPAGAALARPRLLRAILDDVLPSDATYPIVSEVTCSHLSPMMAIPLFRPAELDLGDVPRLTINCDRHGEPVRVEGADALTQSL